MTIFLLASGFLVTFLLNPELSATLSSIIGIEDGPGFLLFFILSILVSAVAGLWPYKIPWQKFFGSYAYGGSFLVLGVSYLDNLDTGLYVFLGFYNLYAAILFMSVWKYDKTGNYIKHKFSYHHRTPIIKVFSALVVMVSIFSYYYLLLDSDSFFWAIPISISVFIWSLVENFWDKLTKVNTTITKQTK